jgi:hypothetical protein
MDEGGRPRLVGEVEGCHAGAGIQLTELHLDEDTVCVSERWPASFDSKDVRYALIVGAVECLGGNVVGDLLKGE